MDAELEELIRSKVDKACAPYVGRPVNSVTLSALKLSVHAAIVHILAEHQLVATFEDFNPETGTMNFNISYGK